MRLTLLAAAALLSGSLAAHADTFNFTFGTIGDSFNGSGSLTGTLVAPGEYQITMVTGTTDTGNGVNRPIAGIQKTSEFQSNDNLLFESSSGAFSFDGFGLSYSLNNGALINVFEGLIFGPSEILERSGGGFVNETVPYSVSVAATPEPSSFALLGTGLLGTLGMLRKRFA